MLTGRRLAYLGMVVGGTVSVAANLLHAYVPPKGAPDDWTPPWGLVFLAAFWPAALWITTELLSRVEWPNTWPSIAARVAGVAPVAAVAAVVSYGHMHGLLNFWLTDGFEAVAGPIAIDGLMVMSGAALMFVRGGGTEVVAEPEPEAAPLVQPNSAEVQPSTPDNVVTSDSSRRPAGESTPKAVVVARMADQIRRDPNWRPDYQALMDEHGKERKTMEAWVSAARKAAVGRTPLEAVR